MKSPPANRKAHTGNPHVKASSSYVIGDNKLFVATWVWESQNAFTYVPRERREIDIEPLLYDTYDGEAVVEDLNAL